MRLTFDMLLYSVGLNQNKIPIPNVLHLRITRRCNFQCQYCFSHLYHDTRKTDIQPEKVIPLLRDGWALGCREVHFSGGEPTLHPNFYQFIEFAKDIGYSITFTSNGWKLGLKELDILDKNDRIRISIDEMHLRGSPNPLEYINHFRTFFSTISGIKCKLVVLTHGEINSEIKAMFSEHGIDAINYPLLKEAINKPIQKQRMPLIRCINPWYAITIDPELTVYPCPCETEPTIGQIQENITLRDIWYSEKMQQFRRKMYSNNPPEQCTTCHKWNRGVKEWIRAYQRIIK